MNKRSRRKRKRKRKRSSIIVLVVVVIRYNSIHTFHTFHSLIIYCKWFTYDDHRYLLMLA